MQLVIRTYLDSTMTNFFHYSNTQLVPPVISGLAPNRSIKLDRKPSRSPQLVKTYNKPLTLAGINIDGEFNSNHFLKAITTNPADIGSRLPVPDILICVETWETILNPPFNVTSALWKTIHQKHPLSSDSKVRGQGGISIRFSFPLVPLANRIKFPKHLVSADSIFSKVSTDPPYLVGGVYMNHTTDLLAFQRQVTLITDQIVFIRQLDPLNLNIPLVIFGDWNLRLGILTRDHVLDPHKSQIFLEFLKLCNLRMVPTPAGSNPYTFSAKNNSSRSAGDFWLSSHPQNHPQTANNPQPFTATIHHELDAHSPHKLVSISWVPSSDTNYDNSFSWGPSLDLQHPFTSEALGKSYTDSFSIEPGLTHGNAIKARLTALDMSLSSLSQTQTELSLDLLTQHLVNYLLDPKSNPDTITPHTAIPSTLHPFKKRKKPPTETDPLLIKANNLIAQKSILLRRKHDASTVPLDQTSLDVTIDKLNKDINALHANHAHTVLHCGCLYHPRSYQHEKLL
jgi:hypothetical protein